jgi:hypothetical protein
MIELTKLRCRKHQNDQVTGMDSAGWFETEDGVWTLDLPEVVCTKWQEHDQCVLTFNIAVQPDRTGNQEWSHDMDEEQFM